MGQRGNLRALTRSPVNRDFKIQRRDGDKKQERRLKSELTFFYISLNDYSYPLTLSNVGEPS